MLAITKLDLGNVDFQILRLIEVTPSIDKQRSP